MSASADDLPKPASPDDALPPVEPPSAGFIVQLFVVPMVIVVIIVGVYLLFNQLAQMGTDPQKHIAQIRKGGLASWQAAHDLATELRRKAELRRDPGISSELTTLLQNELAKGDTEANAVNLRVFLCKALGEFDRLEGLPALLQAASAQADKPEATPVRLSAVESLALLASKLHSTGDKPPIMPAEEAAAPLAVISAGLVDLSHDDDQRMQSTVAFALGVVGDEKALARLRGMVVSAEPDVRFNAATGLARWGDTACLPVLEEMIDPQALKEATEKEEKSAQEFKQVQIMVNGLRAARQLATMNSEADLASLRRAITKLRETDNLLGPVEVELAQALQQLDARKAVPEK
ncbi:MAG: HEAT repeat domain-containing protein [Pirellulales bacterium]